MEAFLPFGYFPYFVLASLMLELISAAHGGFFCALHCFSACSSSEKISLGIDVADFFIVSFDGIKR